MVNRRNTVKQPASIKRKICPFENSEKTNSYCPKSLTWCVDFFISIGIVTNVTNYWIVEIM